MDNLTKSACVLLFVGVAATVIQFIYTSLNGEIDANGFLNDTIFIPIGVFSLLGAGIVFGIAGIRYLLKRKSS